MKRGMDQPIEQRACDVCGARLYPGADWCGLCLARTDPRTRPMGGGGGSRHLPMWYPEKPLPPERYSRWHGGATTFGPVGRILTTVVVVGLSIGGFLVVRSAAFLGMTGWLAYNVIAAATLRGIWRRDRVA